MARNASDVKQKLRKGLWSPEEDEKLLNYITRNGVGCWSSVPKLAGLQRCGKSCRLRWINYLRPDLKRGMFEQHEENLILALHKLLGNRWAQIATQLPGRTDNEIKNYWNSCLKKKLIKQGIDPNTHEPTTTKTEAENVNPSQKPPLFLPQSSILEPSSDHHFMSKLPDFDPSLLFDLQTGHNPMGYTSNLVADDRMGGGIIECVDFSENSSSNESCNVMNNNNNNNMAVDGSIFCWEGENKLESLLQFECCDGIKSEEEQFYSENSGYFWSYNDVPGPDLQVFHQT